MKLDRLHIVLSAALLAAGCCAVHYGIQAARVAKPNAHGTHVHATTTIFAAATARAILDARYDQEIEAAKWEMAAKSAMPISAVQEVARREQHLRQLRSANRAELRKMLPELAPTEIQVINQANAQAALIWASTDLGTAGNVKGPTAPTNF